MPLGGGLRCPVSVYFLAGNFQRLIAPENEAPPLPLLLLLLVAI